MLVSEYFSVRLPVCVGIIKHLRVTAALLACGLLAMAMFGSEWIVLY